MSHRLTAYVYLLLVSAIWGWAGPVIKFTLSSFPPLIFLTYRFALSSIFALVVWRGRIPFPKSKGKTFHILLASLLTVPVALLLLFLGFDRTSSLEGTLVASTSPLLTTILGVLVLHDQITKREKMGMLLAFAGTIFLVFEPIVSGDAIAITGSVIGNGLIVLAMLSESIGFLITKVSLREAIAPTTLSHLSFIVGFAVISMISLFIYPIDTIIHEIAEAPLNAHLGVWFMALISGTLAYALKNKALKSIELSETTVFSYLSPIFAAPLALFWLGEAIRPVFIFASFVIAIGVIMAEYKKKHRAHVKYVRRLPDNRL
ncbi:MAG: DMT family transporter [bacterium]|nr:DMT family transporter [bacterium]